MKNLILNYTYFPFCALMLVTILGSISFTIKFFSDLCPGTIKLSVYTYFMTVYTVIFFLFMSEELSWIGENGKPASIYVHYFLSILGFFIDIKQEFYIILSMLSFIFIPTIFYYIVCGLAGLGRLPVNLGKVLKFSILVYAKSLLPFSAIGISFLAGIVFTEWGKQVHAYRFIYLISCLIVTLFSLFLIFSVVSWKEILIKANINDTKIIKILKIINNFATRKESKVNSCLSGE